MNQGVMCEAAGVHVRTKRDRGVCGVCVKVAFRVTLRGLGVSLGARTWLSALARFAVLCWALAPISQLASCDPAVTCIRYYYTVRARVRVLDRRYFLLLTVP